MALNLFMFVYGIQPGLDPFYTSVWHVDMDKFEKRRVFWEYIDLNGSFVATNMYTKMWDSLSLGN